MQVCCASVLCECPLQVCCECAVRVLCSRLGCSRAHAILVLPTVPLKQVLSNGQESVCHYTNTDTALHKQCARPSPGVAAIRTGPRITRWVDTSRIGAHCGEGRNHMLTAPPFRNAQTCAYVNTYIRTYVHMNIIYNTRCKGTHVLEGDKLSVCSALCHFYRS